MKQPRDLRLSIEKILEAETAFDNFNEEDIEDIMQKIEDKIKEFLEGG